MQRISLALGTLAILACAVHQAHAATGTVNVNSPGAGTYSSSLHYVATATTSCPRGVAAMGIYTAPRVRVYTVRGAKLDKVLNLAPGSYDTVVQAWDNCGTSAWTHVKLTVASTTPNPPPVPTPPPVQNPPPPPPPPPVSFTTTLAAETGNNTSAANGFITQSNGNLGATNVSKVDIHSLLYTGATTDIYAELQPWFGDKRHMKVGYISWDPLQVDRQLIDMQSRGITGVVIDWYGPADATEATTLAWLAAAQNHPGFKVVIMIDKGAVTLSPCSGCSPQQTVIYLTNYVIQHYASTSAYGTWNGKPVITQFDLDRHFTLDWNAIQAATSSNIAWIFQNSFGFTHPVASGSYSWMNATSSVYGMDYLTKFYNAAMVAPQEMAWGAGYKGFNDTLASWSLNRVVGQQCGQTWLQTFSMLNGYYNSGKQLPLLQLVTWNDYEEGTELESGIDNCMRVSAQISGKLLQWNVTGNENTLDHYSVYFSTDNQHLLELNQLAPGTHAMDLSPFSLASGTLYVQAVGKPSIKNQISPAVVTPW
jgi:hypothetical protein